MRPIVAGLAVLGATVLVAAAIHVRLVREPLASTDPPQPTVEDAARDTTSYLGYLQYLDRYHVPHERDHRTVKHYLFLRTN